MQEAPAPGAEARIGTITHVWRKAGAAQVSLDGATLRVGDVVRIRGRGHDFVQEVLSLEVDRVACEAATPGEPAAIAVMQPVRERDEVFMLRRRPLPDHP